MLPDASSNGPAGNLTAGNLTAGPVTSGPVTSGAVPITNSVPASLCEAGSQLLRFPRQTVW